MFQWFFFLCVDKLLFEGWGRGRGRVWRSWGAHPPPRPSTSSLPHPDCNRTGRQTRSGQTFRPSSRLRTPDWTKGVVRQVARWAGPLESPSLRPFLFFPLVVIQRNREGIEVTFWEQPPGGGDTGGAGLPGGGATGGATSHHFIASHTHTHTLTQTRVCLQQMMFYIYRNKVKNKKKSFNVILLFFAPP